MERSLSESPMRVVKTVSGRFRLLAFYGGKKVCFCRDKGCIFLSMDLLGNKGRLSRLYVYFDMK